MKTKTKGLKEHKLVLIKFKPDKHLEDVWKTK